VPTSPGVSAPAIELNATLPGGRLGLRLAGIPVLDDLVCAALDRDISVVTVAPHAPWKIEVEREGRSYLARASRTRSPIVNEARVVE